jgi:alpha-tubulin suppressor-like RCC1 family protein
MSKVVGFVLLLIGLLVGPGASRSAEAMCVLTSTGGVKCWGANLGDGTLNTSATPVDVPGLTSGVIQITDGGATCVLTAAGGVKCWGYNGSGQVGNGTITSQSPFIVPSPVDVVGLSNGVVQIAAGASHTCAVTTMRTVKCWGSNGDGELGTGTSGPPVPTPVDVTGLTEIAQVSAGTDFTCALSTSGGVKCWGWNDKGCDRDSRSCAKPTPF